MEPAVHLQPGVTKWDIRQKVWDYMEKNNLANFPRPVHHRIPNFKGAYDACNKIKNFDCFIKARDVKVDPDKPLEGIRLATLQARKTLLVPTPRLRTGLFNKIVPPPGVSKEMLRVCSTAQGVKDFSVPVGLDAKVHIDLVVVGSVAVSSKGWRIGKGEGFADLEYSMMVSMGSIDENTIVITTVHDCQLLDIPEELMDNHDLIVDYILTPTQVIRTDCKRSKPQGIIWSKETMDRFPERRYPMCAGAIDGTHIPIIAPHDGTQAYYNRKGWYSIVIQAVEDHNYWFMDVYVGWPGRTPDARVLANYRKTEGQGRYLFPHEESLYPTVQRFMCGSRNNLCFYRHV